MKTYSGEEIIEKETGGEHFSRPLASNSNAFDSNVSNNEVFEITVFLIVTQIVWNIIESNIFINNTSFFIDNGFNSNFVSILLLSTLKKKWFQLMTCTIAMVARAMLSIISDVPVWGNNSEG